MGEAGIGKSSLVDALRAQLPAEGRMFVGYCDDLATPRTLGPFRDLVGSVGSRAQPGRAGRRRPGPGAQPRCAQSSTGPSIRPCWSSRTFTGRTTRPLTRCATSSGGSPTCPAVLVLTYRDDELTAGTPLYGLLRPGVPQRAMCGIWPLRRLSHEAVRQLSAGSPVNADNLFALTSGNPFFVGELLASAQGEPSPARSWTPCWPGSGSWTRPSRTCLSSWPWCRPRWSAGWSTRSCPTAQAAVAALAAAEQGGLLTVSAAQDLIPA